jgi:adenosylmethionine-8-amino-7-oxononanoate aminotransferase
VSAINPTAVQALLDRAKREVDSGLLPSVQLSLAYRGELVLFETFGGHPVSCAVANANLDLFAREDICGNVLANQSRFKSLIDGLRDIAIVGDVRGDGYFLAIELVTDQATRGTFTQAQADWLLRDYLSPRLLEAGLFCRADDRGEPVITLAPPLIAGEEEFVFIEATLRTVLADASLEFTKRT